MENKKIYNLINISSILNIIMYVIYTITTTSFLSIFNIYITICLLLSGIFYQNLLKKEINEIREQKTLLLLFAIFSFPVNLVSSLLVFIVVDELEKLSKTNKLRGSPKKIFKVNNKTDLILKLGIGLIIISSLLFITQTYDIIPNIVKVLIIFIVGIIFSLLSKYNEKKLNNKKMSNIYYFLSIAFILISYNSFRCYNIYNLNSDFYYSTTCVLISLLSYISFKKYNNNILKEISLLFIMLSLYFAIIYANIFIGLLLLLTNIILLILHKDDLKLATYIFMLFTIFFTKKIDAMYGLLNGFVVLLSILYLNNNCKNKNYNIVTALSLPLIILTVLSKTDLTIETSNIIISSSLICLLYTILGLIKYNKDNKYFNYTLQIISNLLIASITIYSFKFDNYSCIYLVLLNILTNIVYININDDNVIEYYSRPFKFILLLLALFIQFKGLPIGIFITLIYLLSSLLYILSKNKIFKYIYFGIFIIFLTMQIIYPSNTMLGILAIIYSILLYLYNINNKKLRLFSFIYMIISIFIGLIITNIFKLGIINISLICILSYILISILHKKNSIYRKISNISLILPIYTLIFNFVLDQEIKQVLLIILGLYTIFIIDKYFIKKESHNKVFENVFISMLLFINLFNNSILVGLFIGTVSILLILFGVYNNKYKHFITIGITFTILNVIYQIRFIINKIPFSIYMLIAGLILIGIVTYKNRKEIEKK